MASPIKNTWKKFANADSEARGEYFNILNHSNFLYPTSTTDATWTRAEFSPRPCPPAWGSWR
jgi:hypothetical protein